MHAKGIFSLLVTFGYGFGYGQKSRIFATYGYDFGYGLAGGEVCKLYWVIQKSSHALEVFSSF